jgi:hypothetical protein
MNKDNIAEKWREEFDKSFVEKHIWNDNPLFYNTKTEDVDLMTEDVDLIKSFISDTLTSHRLSLKEELLKKLPRECEFDCKVIINQVLKEE